LLGDKSAVELLPRKWFFEFEGVPGSHPELRQLLEAQETKISGKQR